MIKKAGSFRLYKDGVRGGGGGGGGVMTIEVEVLLIH